MNFNIFFAVRNDFKGILDSSSSSRSSKCVKCAFQCCNTWIQNPDPNAPSAHTVPDPARAGYDKLCCSSYCAAQLRQQLYPVQQQQQLLIQQQQIQQQQLQIQLQQQMLQQQAGCNIYTGALDAVYVARYYGIDCGHPALHKENF